MTAQNELFELAAIATITIATVYLALFMSVLSKSILYFSFPHMSNFTARWQSNLQKVVILFIKPSIVLFLRERSFCKYYFKSTILHLNIKLKLIKIRFF